MVNTTDFGNRIQQIMEYYALSASGFADAMGVGRSSISHILSGRNKPSLDFVMKITEAYPEAELHWLLYGKGVFPKSKETVIKKEQPIQPTNPPTSTPLTNTIAIQNEDQDLFSQEEKAEIEKVEITTKESTYTPQNDIPTPRNGKEIHQIVFFYKDGTFDAFKN